jgi:hypothetical protein
MKKVFLKRKLISEEVVNNSSSDITIAPEFMDVYINIERQRNNLQKQINMYQKQMNDLDKKIIEIKQKSAIKSKTNAQQAAKDQPTQQQPQQPQQTTQSQVESIYYNEKIDKLWEEYIKEDSEINLFGEDSIVDFTDNDSDTDDIYLDDENLDIDLDDENEYSDQDDEIFILKLKAETKESIIKFYKDDEADFWHARVVEGPKEPLESMRFEPGMDKLDIIQKVNDIPGFDDIEELDIEEYKDLVDDKDEIDKKIF